MSRGTSRRAFLRGAAGVAVALPFLPSLLARSARAEADDLQRRPRFVAVFAPCGAYLPTWTPTGSGTRWSLSPTLAPLAGHKARTTVITGLGATATDVPKLGYHHRETASWLTASTIEPTFDAMAFRNGFSLDQRLADHHFADAAVPSVQLGPPVMPGYHDPLKPYAEAYASAVSWRGPVPLLGAFTPEQVWLRLVGDGTTSLTGPLLEAERRRKRSVLDFVVDDLASVRARLGVEDDDRLDAYLTGVRELEQDLDRTTTPPACDFDHPGFPYHYEDHIETMLAIVARLLECDVTRVATVMLNGPIGSRVWTELGHTETHHELTHHDGDPVKIAAVERIDLEQVGILARFVDRLVGATDGAGSSLLDHTAVLYGSGMGDGSQHDWRNLPMLYVGDAGGRLRTGLHVHATDRPLADLHLALLQAYGLDVDAFGDSVAPLDDVLA